MSPSFETSAELNNKIISSTDLQTIHPDSVCCYKEAKESNNFGFRKWGKNSNKKQQHQNKWAKVEERPRVMQYLPLLLYPL